MNSYEKDAENVYEALEELTKTFGYDVILAGGAVRDGVLMRPVVDYDIFIDASKGDKFNWNGFNRVLRALGWVIDKEAHYETIYEPLNDMLLQQKWKKGTTLLNTVFVNKPPRLYVEQNFSCSLSACYIDPRDGYRAVYSLAFLRSINTKAIEYYKRGTGKHEQQYMDKMFAYFPIENGWRHYV